MIYEKSDIDEHSFIKLPEIIWSNNHDDVASRKPRGNKEDMIMELKTLRTFDPNNQSIQIFTSIDYNQ